MNVNDPRWASIDAFVEENRDNILRDITRLVAVPSVEGAPEPGAPFGPGPKAALAKALEIADELGIDITANAGAYGSHYAIMDQYNVIVLAPQVRTYYNEMKADTDRLGITLLSPKGKQYIDLTKDPKGAVAWIEENLEA